MKVVEIGNIGSHNGWMPEGERLPESGIVIEATKEELKSLRGNLLYREVEIKEVSNE